MNCVFDQFIRFAWENQGMRNFNHKEKSDIPRRLWKHFCRCTWTNVIETDSDKENLRPNANGLACLRDPFCRYSKSAMLYSASYTCCYNVRKSQIQTLPLFLSHAHTHTLFSFQSRKTAALVSDYNPAKRVWRERKKSRKGNEKEEDVFFPPP